MKNYWIRLSKQSMVESLITHLLWEFRGVYNHIVQGNAYSNWNLVDFELYLLTSLDLKLGNHTACNKFRRTQLGTDVVSAFAFSLYVIKTKQHNQFQTALDSVNQQAFDMCFHLTDLFFSGMTEEEIDMWTIDYFQGICL